MKRKSAKHIVLESFFHNITTIDCTSAQSTTVASLIANTLFLCFQIKPFISDISNSEESGVAIFVVLVHLAQNSKFGYLIGSQIGNPTSSATASQVTQNSNGTKK